MAITSLHSPIDHSCVSLFPSGKLQGWILILVAQYVHCPPACSLDSSGNDEKTLLGSVWFQAPHSTGSEQRHTQGDVTNRRGPWALCHEVLLSETVPGEA